MTSQYWSACLGGANNRQHPAQVGATRIDSTIDFSWGDGSPAGGITVDDHCDEHTGVITVPSNGNYCFDLLTDDGATMQIGTNTVVNDWYDHATTTAEFTKAGRCVNIVGQASINIKHYDATGASFLRLVYKDASGTAVTVPSDWLTPGPRSMPRGWALSADADASLAYVKATIGTATVVLTDGSGVTHEFRRTDINNPAAGFTPPEDDKSILSIQSDGSYRLTGEDGQIYSFRAWVLVVVATPFTLRCCDVPCQGRSKAAGS